MATITIAGVTAGAAVMSGMDGTITIPLEITLRVGSGSDALEPVTAVAARTSGLDPDAATVAAIADLRANRQRSTAEYYDEAADAIDRERYFSHIDPSVSPDALYAALSALTRTTHRTTLDYAPATHLYPDVDLHPDGSIVSIYSARMLDPEALIRADAEIERSRRIALQSLAASRTLSSEDLTVLMGRIEEALPFNCEHVVPQSWFAKRLPMKGDLHHLFACEIKCNELRANTPYFDFTPDDVGRPDCGRAEVGRFEPVGGKGQVARATLYFLLRYPGEIDDNEREYTRDRLSVLLRWHREHEVTLHERHRNRTIAGKQGNRNPLVDHPEWAERIDWTNGLR
jgi:endonuclease I